MLEKDILTIIQEYADKLPKFPDGRIDYSESDSAPVISVCVEHNGKILLLKRSEKVDTYPGKWNVVAGYLDEVKPVREKILEELNEELGIEEHVIFSIHIRKPYKLPDKQINKAWLIHPILVELKQRPTITLDWEHTEYKWIEPDKLKDFDIIPGLDKSLKNALIPYSTSEVK